MQITKFTIDKISFDDGKTWFEAHFVNPESYSTPEIHPTGGHGDIIKPIKEKATAL